MRKRATQADVARVAGVSRQLVSLAINNDPRVAPASRKAIMEAVKATGYRVNTAARTLVSARSRLVGIMMPDFVNPFYSELAELLKRRCAYAGLTALFTSSGAAEEDEMIQRFVELQADALILISPLVSDEMLDAVAAQVPVTLITQRRPPDTVDSVYSDDELGAKLVTRALVKGGYNPIVFMGLERGVDIDSTRLRLRGYEKELRVYGRQPETYILSSAEEATGATERILERHGRGTGIVAHNDMLAFLVATTVLAEGYRIGEDIGISGFDNTYVSRVPSLELTTIDQDTERMADLALKMVKDRFEGRTKATSIEIAPVLVERSSSAGVEGTPSEYHPAITALRGEDVTALDKGGPAKAGGAAS